MLAELMADLPGSSGSEVPPGCSTSRLSAGVVAPAAPPLPFSHARWFLLANVASRLDHHSNKQGFTKAQKI